MQREKDTKPHTRSPAPILDHPQGALGGHGRGDQVWPRRDRDRHRRHDPYDWTTFKERIELGRVATELLGEPQKTGGSGRMWWLCPFHPDRNPSFCVTPGFSAWKCFGCSARGDAVDLVMKLRGVMFVEAISQLKEMYGWVRPPSQGNGVCWSGRSGPPQRAAGSAPWPSREVPSHPTGLSAFEARELVAESRRRLWSPEGLRYRRWLHLRGLTNATIREAGLGWTPGVAIPTRGDIRSFRAGGIVLPWFDGDRLAMVKVRQPAARKPKYVDAYRDRPGVYPSSATVRRGAPLILVEGEFDALLMAQELGDLASVVTVGSASAQPQLAEFWELSGSCPIFAAHDADAAGDRAAASWPSPVVRVRPPSPDKDWTDAARAGVDLLRWWRDRIAGIERPDRLGAEEEDRLERAAMMEFDGGLSREAADHAAGILREREMTS